MPTCSCGARLRLNLPVMCTCAGFSSVLPFPSLWNRFRLQPRVRCVSGTEPPGRGWQGRHSENEPEHNGADGSHTTRGGLMHVIVWMKPQRHCWNSIWSQRSPISALGADRERILLRAERGNPLLDWTWNGFYTKAQQEVDRQQYFSTFVDLTLFFFANLQCREDKSSMKFNNPTSAYRQLWRVVKCAHFAVNVVQ